MLALGPAFAAQPAKPPRNLTATDILNGRSDYFRGQFTGVVEDVFDDETDNAHVFLVLSQQGERVLAPVENAERALPRLRELIGATVTATGYCDSFVQTKVRRHMGRRFNIPSVDRIKVIAPPADIFNAPDSTALDGLRPSEIVRQPRHRALGRVLAVWDDNLMLVRTPSNRLMRVELAAACAPPKADACVEIVGYPETDLFNINFVQAAWRPAAAWDPPTNGVREIRAADLHVGVRDRRAFDFKLIGQTLRLRGTVIRLPLTDESHRQMFVRDGSDLAIVELGDVPCPPELTEGALVEVTGVCVADLDNWRTHCPFVKIRSACLVARTASDLRMVAAAPWWTPGRLALLVGALVVLLAGILYWNFALRIRAERRGRELYREQIQSVKYELKMIERTRLAIELHDAISQYLTGIALELRTVAKTAGAMPAPASRHLDVAAKTLASCRDELRNCLWDLRNSAIDQRDIGEAIRLAITPHIGEAKLLLRLNVPRKALGNAAHAILQVARELATNAVRHGHATEIKVAGAIDGGTFRMSVRDNGTGFDPARCPGMEEGHFGLLGVRERIAKYEGEVRIDSAPGRGTRVDVSLPLDGNGELP